MKNIKHWHHSPLHIFEPSAMYIVTASTLYKQHYFRGEERLELLQNTLIELLDKYGWQPQAWTVFSNHYHFISQAPEDAANLKTMIQHLHSVTARNVNRLDGTPGRQVWFQYWDTCLTYEKSYHARLNYVNYNPVKHKLVDNPEAYPFCSAAWFKEKAAPEFQEKLKQVPFEKIKIEDDFEVVWK